MKNLTIGALGVSVLLAAGIAWAANPTDSALTGDHALTGNTDVTPHAGMLRDPDVSASHIVFTYANDLWLVPRTGGTALPLASPPGRESVPRFSPDGKTVAFRGNYEGNSDLYTIPVTGGIAHRVTYHPSFETPNEWTHDGRIIFTANGRSDLPAQTALMTIPAEGGLATMLPVPYGALGTIDKTGTWLAYTPYTRDNRTWKRYRGGLATDIWLFNLQTHESRKVTDWEGTDSIPMWHGNKLYYVSDEGGSFRRNIWSYNPQTGARSQVTRFTNYDVKTPAIGPGANGQGEIVMQVGGKLVLVDLGNGRVSEVEVTIPGDRPYLRSRIVDASKNIQGWGLSPNAKRAAVAARGDIWTLPAENGAPRNLTHSVGQAERAPTWSPDGRWVAYFCDMTGEYELYVTQSDGKGDTRQLTTDGGPFKMGMWWSPDSEYIVYADSSGTMHLTTVESGETKVLAKDNWPFVGGMSPPSWSHDSAWITWSGSTVDSPRSAIFVYNVEEGTTTQATSGMFGENSPTFDKKGDWMFFQSDQVFSPTYSSVDTTFIYEDSEILLAVPLRADIESPWLPKSDEETWKDEDEEEEEGDESDDSDGEGDEEAADEEAEDEDEDADAPVAVDDGISGTWEGSLTGDMLPGGQVPITVNVSMSASGTLSGDVVVPMGTATITSGSFDKSTGAFEANLTADDGMEMVIRGTVTGGSMTGTVEGGGMAFEFSMSRSSTGGGEDGDDDSDGDSEEAQESVTIDFEGFERRAMRLPVGNGNFGTMGVNDKNQLIYVRRGGQGGGGATIKLFDLKDDKKSEKQVAAGGFFQMTADGKKLLIPRGASASIQGASAGGSGKAVSTAGMNVRIDPMAEWKQLFTDAWRIERDFFYDPNMHGVDWKGVHDLYMPMVEGSASREDVTYVIGEMIAELNVGHAYITGAGEVENAPSRSVGMLGCDFALENGAYRITRIVEGGIWDSDARGPLSQPGVDVKVGDYLLAVNGVPVDTSMEPWASFVDLANKSVTLTVSENPEMDDEAREVLVKAASGENSIRFRSWIEANRAYVDEQTNGRVGYIYVPNTGVQGQNELYRQFYQQFEKDALIIDERWNGGGQIPTRFIELLNRPATNYWATRGGERDWHWPPDSHQGPKCMLINGRAGSGGDAFPAYFKQAGLGKLIGTRTWGGLVGISGGPQLVDGGSVSAPSFAYYELDGTWGIEGHGVDPDIEVVDDPALMVDGSDPQLDAAIAQMMKELRSRPHVPPKRPAYPDRSGMGILDRDR